MSAEPERGKIEWKNPYPLGARVFRPVVVFEILATCGVGLGLRLVLGKDALSDAVALTSGLLAYIALCITLVNWRVYRTHAIAIYENGLDLKFFGARCFVPWTIMHEYFDKDPRVASRMVDSINAAESPDLEWNYDWKRSQSGGAISSSINYFMSAMPGLALPDRSSHFNGPRGLFYMLQWSPAPHHWRRVTISSYFISESEWVRCVRAIRHHLNGAHSKMRATSAPAP